MTDNPDANYDFRRLAGVLVAICKTCSAIVYDPKVHTEWHKENTNA